MKKLTYAAIFFCFLQTTYAQVNEGSLRPLTNDQKSPDFLQYRPRLNIKVGAGLGTTWRYKQNFLDASALSFSVEPTYRLTNYVSLGLRGEYTLMKSYLSKQGRVKSDPIGSVALTGDVIKLWNNKFAPFVGIGAGAYFLGNGQFPVTDIPGQENIPATTTNLGTRFGISPRIGVNIMSFFVALEMHLIDEKTFNNRDYATLKIGYTL